MWISPSKAMNGERAVVLVFVFRILSSLPFSLLPHALSLSLLSLFSLFVEIRADDSLFLFKTSRPGASSGIMLGAITLPTVMLSKLIQLSRAFSLQRIELDELEHMTMQFWATSACCCGVLIFLSIVMWCAANNKNPHFSCSVWDAKFSLSCVILYSVVCCISLATISHTGFNTALKLLWLLCHGFAAVKLIQHLLNTFPCCASIGEALLVTSGLVLYFGDMLACTISKVRAALSHPIQAVVTAKSSRISISMLTTLFEQVCRLLISPELVSIRYGIKRSEIGIIIQGVLLGLLIFSAVFKFVICLWEYFWGADKSESRQNKEIGRSLIFFTSLGFIMIAVAPSWMMIVLDFDVHPLLWIFLFVFSEPLKRLSLCIYWLGLIFASVLRFYNISKNSKIERILLRKYYHLLAVLMFLPALIYQPKFLDLAFGAALAVFLVLEIIRVWRIWPLGKLVHQFMSAFTDHRDSDLLIVSHFSLLLGCALPIWMSSGFNDRPLTPFAGILSLGIGDTMASMVGHKYGVLRWSKTGKKTIEGTAAGITSVLAACSVLLPLLASTGYILTQVSLSLSLSLSHTHTHTH
ncbi:dolichol kinase EVAN-like isoform X3 [Durio zibethinus]|uniref:dolichol kinase n=1 Tax=Durio zibethinus TaxID=66656 RepID=A0A6P5ZKG6_DURZI|nr:dolichol kinase EVAN-like isoform X3 [Durio zibethinus]